MNFRSRLLAFLMISSLVIAGIAVAQESDESDESLPGENETVVTVENNEKTVTEVTTEETSDTTSSVAEMPKLVLPPVPGEGSLLGDRVLPPLPENIVKVEKYDIKSKSGKLTGRYGISLNTGFTDASYEGINDFFDRVNSYYPTAYYDHFGGGLNITGNVFYCMSEQIRMSFGLGHFGDSIHAVIIGHSSLIGDENNEYNLDRTISVDVYPLSLNMEYYKDWIYGIRLFGGAGIGLYSLNFAIDSWFERSEYVSDEKFFDYDFGSNGKRHWTGSSPGLLLSGGAEYFLNNHVALEVRCDYRNVNINQVNDFNAEPFLYIHENTGSPEDFDGDGTGAGQWTTGESPVPFDLTGFTLGINLKYIF